MLLQNQGMFLHPVTWRRPRTVPRIAGCCLIAGVSGIFFFYDENVCLVSSCTWLLCVLTFEGIPENNSTLLPTERLPKFEGFLLVTIYQRMYTHVAVWTSSFVLIYTWQVLQNFRKSKDTRELKSEAKPYRLKPSLGGTT